MRRSLANYRRSDVRSKPHVKGIIHKRQRTLGEFKIPTTAILPLRKRDGMNVVEDNNDNASPIVLDEDGSTLYQDDVVQQEEKMVISSQEEIVESHETVYSSGPLPSVCEVDGGFADDVIEIIEPENEMVQEEYEMIEESQGDIVEITESIDVGTYDEKKPAMECPICHVDISHLELYAREAHCERCLDTSLPQGDLTKQRKAIQQSVRQGDSPKKSLPQPVKKVPKEKKEKPHRPKKQRPPLPSIKILTFRSNYKIVVDGFNFDSHREINKYFLSHFHADHYMGIGKTWNQGMIYCSKITSKLLQVKFKILPETIVELEEDSWVAITELIDVMTMDANHCPGASIFLFRERNEEGQVVKRILHTGDFRVTEALSMKIAHVLDGCKVDQIYLDTTYLNVGNSHPTQAEVIDKTAKYMKSYFTELDRRTEQDQPQQSHNILDRLVKKPAGSKRKNIILVGSYSIGKEKLAQGIASELNGGNKAIYINEDKDLRQYFIPAGERLMPGLQGLQGGGGGGESGSVDVHIVPLRILKDDKRICEYIRQQYDGLTWLDINLVGIIPTGWTFHGVWGYQRRPYDEKVRVVRDIIGTEKYGSHIEDKWFNEQMARRERKKLKERGKFDIFNVPYSEHSSFPELIQFLCGSQWDEIIPTVNMDKLEDMREWFDIIKKSIYIYD